MRKFDWIATFMVCLIVAGTLVLSLEGYALSEKKALNNLYPGSDGIKMFEQQFNNKKIIIRQGYNGTYAVLFDIKWGFLFRVSGSASFSMSLNKMIERTWSLSSNSNKRYDAIFAVKVTDPSINKVIVTNENIDDVILNDLSAIKSKSNVFIELPLKNGYGAAYKEMDPSISGGFVYRGIDDKGTIKFVTR
ncbi:hypothetical protein M3223_12060 [Paenibacillus pasadenensis]|uniref:hypothetical protein n=1 Tax=Paenibacillus pasadenensis TaxID=217090 RepID=UPI00203F357C|nr:hypothetical protein [Paenibacillus pasadenensis]MCM3748088.1 hypothetical protein [Paenibacillus pasadenensis]